MDKTTDNHQNDQQEKAIEKALFTGGFLFPQTVDEVKEFERIYGTTDIILPIELQEPEFLDGELSSNSTRVLKFPAENFAMAAREGSSKLPTEIKQKILKDIKDSESSKRKKKKR